MAKFDWSRVNLRSFDPARYLPSRDFFITPDNPQSQKRKKAKGPLPAALKRQLRHEARMVEQRAARLKRKAAQRAVQLEQQRLRKAENAKRQAQAKERRDEAKRLKKQKMLARKAAAEARIAAFAEYQKTPEYTAKLECQRAKMAAKKRSHLEAWAEQQTGLKMDRTTLKQRWRARLLAKRGE